MIKEDGINSVDELGLNEMEMIAKKGDKYQSPEANNYELDHVVNVFIQKNLSKIRK